MHEWYPSECAPVSAPVRILSACFTTRDGAQVHIPAGGIMNNGWGVTGTTYMAGPSLKALPEWLQIRWFSFLENRFYGGEFRLDTAQLDSVFGAGYESPVNGETKLFDRILVGLSPGGGVALWLKGEQIAREIGFFQAAQTEEDWTAFSDGSSRSRSEYVQSQLHQVPDSDQVPAAFQAAQSGLAHWQEAVRRKYSWEPRFLSRGRMRQMMLRCWNGEAFLNSDIAVPGDRPLPQQIDVYWANPDGVNYGASIVFDFAETAAAFQALTTGSPLRLDLEADTLAAELTVFLTNAAQAYRFRKSTVRVFQM